MSRIEPFPVKHKIANFKPFIFKDLNEFTHVFKLVKKVKPPLERPYMDPHEVISRHKSDEYFKIHNKNKQKTYSVEHIKPDFFINDNLEPEKVFSLPNPKPNKANTSNPTDNHLIIFCLYSPNHPKTLER